MLKFYHHSVVCYKWKDNLTMRLALVAGTIQHHNDNCEFSSFYNCNLDKLTKLSVSQKNEAPNRLHFSL